MRRLSNQHLSTCSGATRKSHGRLPHVENDVDFLKQRERRRGAARGVASSAVQ